MMKRDRREFVDQWAWPVALAGLAVCGLIAALVADGGLSKIMCWAVLALPVVVIAWHVARVHRG